jgi:hypothetical protein
MHFNFYTNTFKECDVLPERTAVIGSNGLLTWASLNEITENYSKTLQFLRIPKGHP